MLKNLVAALTILLSGCTIGAAISVTPRDAAGSDADAALAADSPRDSRMGPEVVANDGVVPDASIAPVVCAGVTCATGETCCLTTGTCFDATTERDTCPTPTTGGGACASNLDCSLDGFCRADPGSACVGPGHCVARDNCGGCYGTACAVCGCDGTTYSNVQLACLAGVRVANVPGACGIPYVVAWDGDSGVPPVRIPCANSTQCPAAQQCCPNTSTCFDPACLDCCRTPPPGTDFPCDTDSQCYPEQYCSGDGCGTPGGCALIRGTGECSGAVEQVCGCDGRTYVNACWATGSGVRISSLGACG